MSHPVESGVSVALGAQEKQALSKLVTIKIMWLNEIIQKMCRRRQRVIQDWGSNSQTGEPRESRIMEAKDIQH